jgi:acetylornithine deacetylase/succinyl-diaminopimelate desuccinylase-like protein
MLPGIRNDLEALIRIPSVSADPGADDDVRQCAELTARLLGAAGAAEVDILDDIEGGKPAVIARYPAPPGRPTVLFYAHYDVQPADPSAWSSPPFQPCEADGRLYGRGSADDKAGIAAHLAALRAYDGRPPVGVTVLVEGEEEIGSPTLGTFLDRHMGRLAADAIVLADSENFEVGVPSFTATLRGYAECVVEVQTLRHGVHSGIYGGAAPDALTALCRLLATLHDDRGNVTIDGLVTGPAPETDYPEERFRSEAAVLDGVPLLATGSIAQRIWASPAATVLAIDAPAVFNASNMLTPTARAKISLRLAPGQDAAEAFRALTRHLRAHTPWGARVGIADPEFSAPYTVDMRGPVAEAARHAYGQAYGHSVAEIGSGGSISFVAQFAAAFPAAEILVTSAGGDHACRAHGPDENLHLADFERACLAETLLLTELAHRPPVAVPG